MRSDEFTTNALVEGRIDEAIRHLLAATPEEAEPRLLAQLLTQRGRFDEALSVVRSDVAARSGSGPISASDLRERGNAAWRADRLDDALTDLREAVRQTTDPTLSEPIRSDLAVLEGEVASLQSIERQLHRVNYGTAILLVALVVALMLVGGAVRRSGRSS